MTYKINDDITLALGGSMMTGNSLKGENSIMRTENCGPNGTWKAEDMRLRGGTIYYGAIFKGQSYFYGHNSEKRLHSIQNSIHKKLGNPYFESLSYGSRHYSYYGSYHSLYLNY